MSLAVAVLSFRLNPGERLTPMRLTGLLIGLIGVILLMGIDVGGRSRELFGAACVLVATICYALGALIVKRRLADLEPLGAIAVALGLSALLLAPAAAASFPTAVPAASAQVSILVLGVACTATALVLYFALIAEAGPGRASVITYVNPLVAVALGIALLGERIGSAATAGVALILAGSWLSTGRDEASVTKPGPRVERRERSMRRGWGRVPFERRGILRPAARQPEAVKPEAVKEATMTHVSTTRPAVGTR